MKIALRLGLILAIGGVPLALHSSASFAQAPPSKGAFILNEYEVRDPAAFKVLATEVRESLKTFKGEFVLREKVDSLFGGTPSNLSVISFPTVADARAWLASPELAKMKADRDRAASVRSYLVEKLD